MNRYQTLLSPLPLLLLLGCATSTGPAGEAPAAPISNRPVELKSGAKNVGIVIFDGLFITELVAPFDVYKHTGDEMNVFTVAQTRDPIRTYYGVGLVADYTFDTCPRIDVLVVPSGIHSVDSDLENEQLVGFVRERASTATWVTSHCWGAFTLAQAGVLRGRECMTFPASIEKLQDRFPAVKTQNGRRFVVDGNVVSSGGGLAAFEAAVWIVDQMLGRETAEKVADGLVFAEQNRAYTRDPRIGGN